MTMVPGIPVILPRYRSCELVLELHFGVEFKKLRVPH